MTPYESWKAEAMRLATDYAQAQVELTLEYDQGTSYLLLNECRNGCDAARAALEAHLEALPMGEPFRWHWQLGTREGMQSEQPAPADHYSKEYVFTPLYRHPKESA
jgi:hypothetical protein